jgi:hypothetical protein
MLRGQSIVFFYNYSSIQLTYVMTGTTQDWISTRLMDYANYLFLLAGKLSEYNLQASEEQPGANGVCKTNIIQNTLGIGSVLLLICMDSTSSSSNCTVWYNQSFEVIVDRCAPNCITGMSANGVCETPCNISACNYDGGDCPMPTISQTETCSANCYLVMLGDDICDGPCDNALCNYDNGDCFANTNPAPAPTPHSRAPSALFATTQGATPQANTAGRSSQLWSLK